LLKYDSHEPKLLNKATIGMPDLPIQNPLLQSSGVFLPTNAHDMPDCQYWPTLVDHMDHMTQTVQTLVWMLEHVLYL